MSRWRDVAVALGLAAGAASASPVLAATSYPNDPYFAAAAQWGLVGQPASIEAPAAWCVSTGAGQLIADVDTGADFAHPDLSGKLVAGARFLGGTTPYPGPPTGGLGDPSAVADDNGHGTLTAGIMAAVTNNGRGIAAVAPDARVLVVKVLDGQGSGFDSDVANGIRWSVDHGATAVNVSIGPDVALGAGVATPQTSDIPDAVHYAATHDVAVALAAGNARLPVSSYLSLGSDALVVGALGPDASVPSYSNFGNSVQIYAPGGAGTSSPDPQTQLAQNIVSTRLPAAGEAQDAYGVAAGTSFATPHVTGTLALLRARGASASSARSRIVGTAVTRKGFPDLDAAHALDAAGTCGAAAAPGPTPAGSAPPASRAPVPAPGSGHASAPAASPPPSSSPAPMPAGSSPSSSSGPVALATAAAATPETTTPRPAASGVPPPTTRGGGGAGVTIGLVVAGLAVLGGAAMLGGRRWRRSH